MSAKKKARVDSITKESNEAARHIVRLVEDATKTELHLSVCMTIIRIISIAIHNSSIGIHPSPQPVSSRQPLRSARKTQANGRSGK